MRNRGTPPFHGSYSRAVLEVGPFCVWRRRHESNCRHSVHIFVVAFTSAFLLLTMVTQIPEVTMTAHQILAVFTPPSLVFIAACIGTWWMLR